MCCTLSQKILHLKGNNTFAITLYQYYEMNRLIGQFIFTCFINSKQLFRITCHLLVLKTGMISWTFIHWREIRQNLRISVIQRRKLTAFFTASGCKNLLTPSSWLYDFYQTVKTVCLTSQRTRCTHAQQTQLGRYTVAHLYYLLKIKSSGQDSFLSNSFYFCNKKKDTSKSALLPIPG